MERKRPPLWFLRQAALLLVLGATEFLVVIMALQGLMIDSVVPRLHPWDESKWVAVATRVTSDAELEGVVGATAEEVIARLGPPTHVNRGSQLPDDCAQAYLYVRVVDGQRRGTGVCVSPSGRVAALLGGYDSPTQMEFDLRLMTGEGLSTETLLLQIPATILALPLAAAIHLKRRLSRRSGPRIV